MTYLIILLVVVLGGLIATLRFIFKNKK